MKTYRVTVGEKEYVVKVEEVDASSIKTEQPKQQTSNSGKGEGEVLPSPIQGSIFKILKKSGDAVKAGEAVLIIEAMKLENEIVAPHDGIVGDILVSEGQTVDAGAALLYLK